VSVIVCLLCLAVAEIAVLAGELEWGGDAELRSVVVGGGGGGGGRSGGDGGSGAASCIHWCS
jgi:hypothetical protein